MWPDRTLEPSSVRLQTYSKGPLTVLGKVNVQVEYEGQNATLPLLVVKGSGPLLLGHDWMSALHPKHMFRDGLGTFVGRKATIEVDPSAKPRYYKARALPYAMRSRKSWRG